MPAASPDPVPVRGDTPSAVAGGPGDRIALISHSGATIASRYGSAAV